MADINKLDGDSDILEIGEGDIHGPDPTPPIMDPYIYMEGIFVYLVHLLKAVMDILIR